MPCGFREVDIFKFSQERPILKHIDKNAQGGAIFSPSTLA